MEHSNTPKLIITAQAKALSGEIQQLTASLLAESRWQRKCFYRAKAADTTT
jgi:hypothetical protein